VRPFKNSVGEYLNTILKASPIIIIFPRCFHLNSVENCIKDNSTETHVKSSKTKPAGAPIWANKYLFMSNILSPSRNTVPLNNLLLICNLFSSTG
jgi:hypothetical protein